MTPPSSWSQTLLSLLCCSKGYTPSTSLEPANEGCWIPVKSRMRTREGGRGRLSPPSGECPSSSELAPWGAGPSQPLSAHHAAPPCVPGPGRQPPEGCHQSSRTNLGSVKSGERAEQLRGWPNSVRGRRGRVSTFQCRQKTHFLLYELRVPTQGLA